MYSLPFDDETGSDPLSLPDADARARATDPAHNVVLEASAGTGKTYVLVDRYLNLLNRSVDPSNILAITFTRKAAAEMRARILSELRTRAEAAGRDRQRWRDIRERSGDIAISTIDAFCLSLLHEFPLEANLDPGFEMADETLVPRLMEEALDRALDISRGLSRTDESVRLLFAEVREPRLREGLSTMIERRLVVEDALERALGAAPADLTSEKICERAFEKVRSAFAPVNGGIEAFLGNGPVRHRRFEVLKNDVRMLDGGGAIEPGAARAVLDRLAGHFLTDKNELRKRFNDYSAKDCTSPAAWRNHLADMQKIGPDVADGLKGFRRDLNAVLSRGVRRVYRIAVSEYLRMLDSHGVLDFSEALARALTLLDQMEEFARSRYRLEGRYHHVLLDEFQDTSRAQWLLVALLIRSWEEGSGVAETAPLVPSIFLVGDRKQSIYGFRDADVAVMEEAADFVDRLRPGRDSRRTISKNFRAVPQLLAFANDLFGEIEKDPSRRDAFHFGEPDKFPVDVQPGPAGALGIVAGPAVSDCAALVAAEIRRLLDRQQPVRDATTGAMRPVAARDIAILFRTKDSHQEFEKALERQEIPSYVYKGLGFFEADEIKDVLALLRYLALPESNLRAAAFLRSRFVRLSDSALQALAPSLASALASRTPSACELLDDEDRRVLEHARIGVARWLSLVDRLPPAELLETVLDETAYLFETRGARMRQARENLKKIRGMIRRVQNRGFATMSRVAEHLERLTAGDESNAVIDAGDSVNLMTIHAAKGLEFPVVFVVNLTRGTGGVRAALRVVADTVSGQGSLSVGGFQSEADEDVKGKNREETKRLLYVAVTRARDRLYLASEVKDGKWRAFGGSLGEILPASFRVTFETAASGSPPHMIEWTAASGQVHTLRVCQKQASSEPSNKAVRNTGAPADRGQDLFDPLVDPFALPRASVTDAIAAAEMSDVGTGPEAHRQTLAGTLVHRLLERRHTTLMPLAAPGDTGCAAITEELRHLLRDEESIETSDLDAVLEQAAGAYRALCSQPEFAAALDSGESFFELPFSFRVASSTMILRGTFDCLVRRRDGGITVLELKTGRPGPQHAQQLSIYVMAARALFPGTAVEGKLVYAGHGSLDDRPFDSNR